MKKTLVSLATITALTGFTAQNVSADEYTAENTSNTTEYWYTYEGSYDVTQNVDASNNGEAVQAPAPSAGGSAEEPQAPAPSESSQDVSSGSNVYTSGDCTWYAFERRQELGKPVGSDWGDATNWAGAASSQGLTVNNSPSVGAIIQSNAFTNGSLGQGHVGVVEEVNDDGSIVVSEMNWNGGFGVQSHRTISASEVSGHNFIH